MNDLGTHLALFAVITFVIVTLGAFYTEAEDGKALRSLPRRFVVFVIGCGIVTAIMLICEHTFARV